MIGAERNHGGGNGIERIEVGSGFHLSPVQRTDRAAYLKHFADPEIARNLLRVPFPYTEADADWWFNHREQNARTPEVHFAIRQPDGFLIGGVGLTQELAPDMHSSEFGYWLAKEHRGQGLMPRVLRAFAVHAFTKLGLHRLQASVFPFNTASMRALEKAGFTHEGTLRHMHKKGNEYLDGVVYGVLASEAPDLGRVEL